METWVSFSHIVNVKLFQRFFFIIIFKKKLGKIKLLHTDFVHIMI
jgi:hypothetical protein